MFELLLLKLLLCLLPDGMYVCVTVIHSAHCSEEFPVSTLVDPDDGHDYEVQLYSFIILHDYQVHVQSYSLIISHDYVVQSYSTNQNHMTTRYTNHNHIRG